MSCQIQRR